MYPTTLTVLLLALATQVACSPFHTLPASRSMTTGASTCTINVLKQPVFETDCTFKERTSTMTMYTDCGGCVLKTKRLGLGLPCQTLTTVPGAATETVQACSSYVKHAAVVTPTATPCLDKKE